MKPRQGFSPAEDSAKEDVFAAQMHYGHPPHVTSKQGKNIHAF